MNNDVVSIIEDDAHRFACLEIAGVSGTPAPSYFVWAYHQATGHKFLAFCDTIYDRAVYFCTEVGPTSDFQFQIEPVFVSVEMRDMINLWYSLDDDDDSVGSALEEVVE